MLVSPILVIFILLAVHTALAQSFFRKHILKPLFRHEHSGADKDIPPSLKTLRAGAVIRYQPTSSRWLTSTNLVQVVTLGASAAAFLKPALKNQWMKINSKIAEGELGRLVSSQLIHGDIIHYAVNTRSMMVIGPQAEKVFGPIKMLGIYLGSGALASFGTYKLNLSPYALGASGGLFGLTGAMVAYYEINRGALGRQSEAGLESIRNHLAGSLVYALSPAGARIDSWGHLGGLAAGYAMGHLLAPRLPIRYFSQARR